MRLQGLQRPPSAVGRGRPAHADQHLPGPGFDRGGDELTGAGGIGPDRVVVLASADQGQPGRHGHLDRRRRDPVVEQVPGGARPVAERPMDPAGRARPPRTAAEPFAPVGDGRLICGPTRGLRGPGDRLARPRRRSRYLCHLSGAATRWGIASQCCRLRASAQPLAGDSRVARSPWVLSVVAMAADQASSLVLSNRGPISFARGADGNVYAPGGQRRRPGRHPRPGGRARPGPVASRRHHPGRQGRRPAEVCSTAGAIRFQPVMIDPDDYRAYYDVIANQTLWFCLHGLWDLPRRPRFDRHWWAAWERFVAVNEQFAEAAAEAAGPGGIVLVQDYQLALVPQMLAKRRPDVRTAAFLHTPWCSPQEFSVLPDEVASALLAGLAGGGACGFHSANAGPRRLSSAAWRRSGGRRRPSWPPPPLISTDLRGVALSGECQRELDMLDSEVGDRQLIVRVDRIELSKNVTERVLGLRRAARDPAGPAGAGGVRGHGVPVPTGSGGVSGLRPGDSHFGRAGQRQVGPAGVDSGPAGSSRQSHPVGGGPAPLGCPPRQSGTGRTQSGGQGRTA